jgi:putative transposase
MARFNSTINHRRSIRLKGYDYSQSGLYFITICTQNQDCLFGEINNAEIILNDAGIMVDNKWLALKNRYPNIDLHEYIVMPNHFHGIIEIVENGQPQGGQPQGGQPQGGQPQGIAPTVGDMIGAFKSLVTNEYIRNVKQNNWRRFNGKLWQRNYYEHIIRDEKSYLQIAEYIETNPLKWQDDTYYV